MKYKLKRDLPFAKAGDKVFSCDVGFYCFVKPNMPVMLPEMMNDKGLTYIGTREILLKEGWIKEVKPRELWIEKHKKIVGITSSLVELHESKPTPCRECQSEIIHVQEILE